jgi:hypothetical protein
MYLAKMQWTSKKKQLNVKKTILRRKTNFGSINIIIWEGIQQIGLRFE